MGRVSKEVLSVIPWEVPSPAHSAEARDPAEDRNQRNAQT